MNTKASSILMFIFELIVVVIVIAISQGVAFSAADPKETVQENSAKELQMMVHTMAALNGDLIVELPYNMTFYYVYLTQNQIAVFQDVNNQLERDILSVSLPKGMTTIGKSELKEHICLEKKAKNIYLRECKVEEHYE